MFGLKIFVRVQTFRRVSPVLPCNFCHPGWRHELLLVITRSLKHNGWWYLCFPATETTSGWWWARRWTLTLFLSCRQFLSPTWVKRLLEWYFRANPAMWIWFSFLGWRFGSDLSKPWHGLSSHKSPGLISSSSEFTRGRNAFCVSSNWPICFSPPFFKWQPLKSLSLNFVNFYMWSNSDERVFTASNCEGWQ